MTDRKTRADFGEPLIRAFTDWAIHTDGKPYDLKNQETAMKAFHLTSSEFRALLFLTAPGWIF